jgi:hypothetical protein
MTQVDTFAPPPDAAHGDVVQAELFKAAGLAEASHTLAIEVTGQKDPAAATAVVVVDAFDVTTSGTRHEETDPAIAYTPGWDRGNRDHAYSEGTAALSATQGDQATFTFTGTSVSWIGFRGPQMGIANVFVDGILVTSVDMYANAEASQNTVFTRSGLPTGSHTLTIGVTGTKNSVSTGTAIVVDAFDVSP